MYSSRMKFVRKCKNETVGIRTTIQKHNFKLKAQSWWEPFLAKKSDTQLKWFQRIACLATARKGVDRFNG